MCLSSMTPPTQDLVLEVPSAPPDISGTANEAALRWGSRWVISCTQSLSSVRLSHFFSWKPPRGRSGTQSAWREPKERNGPPNRLRPFLGPQRWRVREGTLEQARRKTGKSLQGYVLNWIPIYITPERLVLAHMRSSYPQLRCISPHDASNKPDYCNL